MRFLREFDQTRFVSGFTNLERDLERDFELLRNRELLCRRGTLNVQDDLAVFQGEWEKIAFFGTRFDRIEQRGTQRMQLMRTEERGATPVWRVTGLAGERIFGQTGDFVDVAVTAFPVPSVLPSVRAVALSATVENVGGTPLTTPILVRFFDATPGAGPRPIGNQTLRGLSSPGRATVSITTTLTTVGRRTLLVVADPENRLRELDEANNRLAASALVGSDAVLTVIPGPGLQALNGNITIRLVDLDQAGRRTVTVRLQHRLFSGPSPGTNPAAFAQDEEAIELTETSPPGTFVRVGIPVGRFDCNPGGSLPFAPTPGNGRLEFPIFVSADCFFILGTATDLLTAIYLDPANAQGRANVEVRATARFTRPLPP
jgi:hypothetical protein